MFRSIQQLRKEVNQFYPHYLKEHNNLGNQILHFTGATLFFAIIASAFILSQWWLVPVAIFIGYLLPGIGHRFFQHNKSFRTSRPVVCVLCAFLLYADTLTFSIGRKMKTTREHC